MSIEDIHSVGALWASKLTFATTAVDLRRPEPAPAACVAGRSRRRWHRTRPNRLPNGPGAGGVKAQNPYHELKMKMEADGQGWK